MGEPPAEPDFQNVYADPERARAYAGLEFPATYYLAFRDLPALFARHVTGRRALDVGCGAGRSTRFLRDLGFEAVGVDIAPAMLERARERDPEGDYRLVQEEATGSLAEGAFDLALAAFPFDNVPTIEAKVALLARIRASLRATGRFVNVASAPEIYRHEWASFSTEAFPENHTARSGDRVRIVMLDVPDRRPVEDVLCTDEAYRDAYRRAGLTLLETHRPLGLASEPYAWVSEETVSPWAIHVLGPQLLGSQRSS